MDNKKMYIIISIISLILMVPSCIWNYSVLNLLSSIGCSGIAASIMAIYIELNSKKKEELRLAKAKSSYFKNINSELNMILERIIWFDDKMNDPQFDWSLPPQEYSSLNYFLLSSNKYKKKDEILSFDEAEKKLKKIGEKYNLERQKEMTKNELAKVQKMFSIIANSCNYLINETNRIKENKLMLDVVDYLPMDKIDSIIHEISLAIGLMGLPNKNYSVSISFLLAASKTIREAGQYTDSIHIGLHGSIQMSEL